MGIFQKPRRRRRSFDAEVDTDASAIKNVGGNIYAGLRTRSRVTGEDTDNDDGRAAADISKNTSNRMDVGHRCRHDES